jgi:hypothetical protein
MRKRKVLLLFLGVFFCFSAAAQTEVLQPGDPGWTPTPPPLSEEEMATQKALDAAERTLPGGYFKMSGRYRLAAGATSQQLTWNDSNASRNLNYLQGPNFRYIFGDRLNNTYDPGIYSQYLLNLDFLPSDKVNFYTQIVNDPWSYVGTTGDIVRNTDVDDSVKLRYNLKYFGAMDSTIGEVYRASDADRFNFPEIKASNGELKPTRVEGMLPGVLVPTDHTIVNIPAHDLYLEYRPVRKLWMDYTEDQWHGRVFALADETQALTSDDPLGLSNHKDYWQQSPWLYQYRPIQYFTDVDLVNSIKRGYYSDDLSYTARDSEGNRLVLLRGAAFEGNFGETYLAGTVAAPITPWDGDYWDADNVPGAFRLKHQVTDRLMLGGTYTFRTGFVDRETADVNEAVAVDAAYAAHETTTLKSEVAFSQRQHELTEAERYQKTNDGYAYKASLESKFEREGGEGTELQVSYTQMDRHFDPPLSRYVDTRDDSFWGNHISFLERPDLEPFRIGDGIDRDRVVLRAQWREKLFKERFQNLLDVRTVRRKVDDKFIETVVRDEPTYKITERLTARGLFRWRHLPKTTAGIEPSLTDLYFPKDDIDLVDFRVLNAAVAEDQDADQYTYSAGLQYVLSEQWTLEGIVERSNAVPDFPRGLLNDFTKSANDRVEGLLIDRITPFLYGQAAVNAVPPYDFYNIFKERLIFRPVDCWVLTLHAAQNGYRYAGGIDDNINHVGASIEFHYGKKWDFFADYTLSRQVDLPHYIDTNFTEENRDYHHNLYFSADYLVRPATKFRVEYGVFDLGATQTDRMPYSSTTLSLPTIDTEHLVRAYLTGDF